MHRLGTHKISIYCKRRPEFCVCVCLLSEKPCSFVIIRLRSFRFASYAIIISAGRQSRSKHTLIKTDFYETSHRENPGKWVHFGFTALNSACFWLVQSGLRFVCLRCATRALSLFGFSRDIYQLIAYGAWAWAKCVGEPPEALAWSTVNIITICWHGRGGARMLDRVRVTTPQECVLVLGARASTALHCLPIKHDVACTSRLKSERAWHARSVKWAIV